MNDKNSIIINRLLENIKLSLERVGIGNCDETWHNDNKIYPFDSIGLVLQGSIFLSSDSKEYVVNEGEMYILPSNRLTSYRIYNCKFSKVCWCHFNSNSGSNRLFDLLDMPPKLKLNLADINKVHSNFLDMSFNLQLKIIGAPLKFNALLYDIIYTYILNTDDNLIKIKNDPSFSSIIKVQDYIDNNTGRTIKVESLAKLSGYTPSYFIELFKKNMNMTPLQYIHKRKLQEAERMILFTDYSVRRISDMLGFCNQNKFSEFFKKQTGYSPLQFKKINAL